MKVQEGIPQQIIDTGRVAAKSFLAGRSIVELYVESEVDVTFWRKRFLRRNVRGLEIKAVRELGGSNGKSEILKNIESKIIVPGPRVLVAIDSDYDYLRGVRTNLYNSPFVFQTYVYSIENYYFSPNYVVEACLEATHTANAPEDKFQVEYAFSAWSSENYPHFVKLIKEKCGASNKQIYSSLKTLDVNNFDESTEVHDIDIDLEGKGLVPDNIYLFIKGHKLDEKVDKISRGLTNWLVGQKHKSIKGITEQATTELRVSYSNSLTPPRHHMLSRCLDDFPFIQSIYDDIQNYKDNFARDILP